MQTKWNEATGNRPEGERPINAPYVYANIEQAIAQLKNEEAWLNNDRNGITLFKSDVVTIVLTIFKANAEMPLQKTDGYVVIQTLSGLVNVITNNLTEQLENLQLIALHPQIEYSLISTKESAVVITVVKNK